MTRHILLLILLLGSVAMRGGDAGHLGYTHDHPLVIAGDWDFRPFEFVDTDGQPAGYNVDVLNLILDQLDIPHKFVMQEWHVATDMFRRREADLLHGLYSFYKGSPYVTTHKYINYYNLKVARRAATDPLHRVASLQPTDTLLVKMDDYAAMALAAMQPLPFAVAFHSPKEGLAGISHGKYKYYVWGEIPLTSKIHELGLEGLALDQIDIPAGELRIIGYNKELIDIIDEQYTRLEQAGELQNVYDRWFHPERVHDDASPLALIILAGLLMAAVGVSLLIWLVRRRVGKTISESSDLGQIMDQVLNMGDYFVVEWDFKTNMLHNKYGNMIPNGGMSSEEFLRRMPQEDARRLHTLNAQLIAGDIGHFDMNLSFNKGTAENPEWRHFYGNAIVERENGKPQYILYTTKDTTQELNEEQRVNTIASKYKKMFDTNLVAMSFYDANGTLLDFNEKMHELCQMNRPDSQYFISATLYSLPNIKGVFMPGSREIMHVCQHLYEPQLNLDKYIEFRICPALDDDGRLVYYIVTTRDVTAERNMYLEQRKHDQRLQAVSEDTRHYERQLSYLLEENKMYIWSYKIDGSVINFTWSPGQTEYAEPIDEYLQSINAGHRQRAHEKIQSAMRQGKEYNDILLYDHTPLDKKPAWYSISGMPIRDKDGNITEYFGLSRNITELMEAQQRLRVETARAKDSGRLKAAFLANMTHEIRTPLNAIVGFSDLLPMVSDEAEKKEFMRIIRNNCDMLLRLITDILEASDINSRPMNIQPHDVDFAQAFDDICQTLGQRVQTPGVDFIKDNPYATFHAYLDKGRIQQVITNFVTNAVKYTEKGHIRVGYKAAPNPTDNDEDFLPPTTAPKRNEGEGLLIYCEDTGAGIPKERQASVFERFVKLNEFVQGTGLGLNICKSIAERCGGTIGVRSEGPGRGSTFWIWVPCAEDDNNTGSHKNTANICP